MPGDKDSMSGARHPDVACLRSLLYPINPPVFGNLVIKDRLWVSRTPQGTKSYNEWISLKSLGSGMYANVKLAYNSITGEKATLRIVNRAAIAKKIGNSAGVDALLWNSARLVDKICFFHPFIIDVKEIIYVPKDIYGMPRMPVVPRYNIRASCNSSFAAADPPWAPAETMGMINFSSLFCNQNVPPWLLKAQQNRDLELGLYACGSKSAIAELTAYNENHAGDLLSCRGRSKADDDMLFIYVREYCNEGSLADLRDLISESMVTQILWQGSSALAFMHNTGIVHQDIKSDNLLLTSLSKKSTDLLTLSRTATQIERDNAELDTLLLRMDTIHGPSQSTASFPCKCRNHNTTFEEIARCRILDELTSLRRVQAHKVDNSNLSTNTLSAQLPESARCGIHTCRSVILGSIGRSDRPLIKKGVSDMKVYELRIADFDTAADMATCGFVYDTVAALLANIHVLTISSIYDFSHILLDNCDVSLLSNDCFPGASSSTMTDTHGTSSVASVHSLSNLGINSARRKYSLYHPVFNTPFTTVTVSNQGKMQPAHTLGGQRRSAKRNQKSRQRSGRLPGTRPVLLLKRSSFILASCSSYFSEKAIFCWAKNLLNAQLTSRSVDCCVGAFSGTAPSTIKSRDAVSSRKMQSQSATKILHSSMTFSHPSCLIQGVASSNPPDHEEISRASGALYRNSSDAVFTPLTSRPTKPHYVCTSSSRCALVVSDHYSPASHSSKIRKSSHSKQSPKRLFTPIDFAANPEICFNRSDMSILHSSSESREASFHTIAANDTVSLQSNHSNADEALQNSADSRVSAKRIAFLRPSEQVTKDQAPSLSTAFPLCDPVPRTSKRLSRKKLFCRRTALLGRFMMQDESIPLRKPTIKDHAPVLVQRPVSASAVAFPQKSGQRRPPNAPVASHSHDRIDGSIEVLSNTLKTIFKEEALATDATTRASADKATIPRPLWKFYDCSGRDHPVAGSCSEVMKPELCPDREMVGMRLNSRKYMGVDSAESTPREIMPYHSSSLLAKKIVDATPSIVTLPQPLSVKAHMDAFQIPFVCDLSKATTHNSIFGNTSDKIPLTETRSTTFSTGCSDHYTTLFCNQDSCMEPASLTRTQSVSKISGFHNTSDYRPSLCLHSASEGAADAARRSLFGKLDNVTTMPPMFQWGQAPVTATSPTCISGVSTCRDDGSINLRIRSPYYVRPRLRLMLTKLVYGILNRRLTTSISSKSHDRRRITGDLIQAKLLINESENCSMIIPSVPSSWLTSMPPSSYSSRHSFSSTTLYHGTPKHRTFSEKAICYFSISIDERIARRLSCPWPFSPAIEVSRVPKPSPCSEPRLPTFENSSNTPNPPTVPASVMSRLSLLDKCLAEFINNQGLIAIDPLVYFGNDFFLSETKGTRTYLAPETRFDSASPTDSAYFLAKPSDVWQFGATFLHAYTNVLRLNPLHRLSSEALMFLSAMGILFTDLVCGMLSLDPLERYTMPEITLHPFFNERNFSLGPNMSGFYFLSKVERDIRRLRAYHLWIIFRRRDYIISYNRPLFRRASFSGFERRSYSMRLSNKGNSKSPTRTTLGMLDATASTTNSASQFAIDNCLAFGALKASDQHDTISNSPFSQEYDAKIYSHDSFSSSRQATQRPVNLLHMFSSVRDSSKTEPKQSQSRSTVASSSLHSAQLNGIPSNCGPTVDRPVSSTSYSTILGSLRGDSSVLDAQDNPSSGQQDNQSHTVSTEFFTHPSQSAFQNRSSHNELVPFPNVFLLDKEKANSNKNDAVIRDSTAHTNVAQQPSSASSTVPPGTVAHVSNHPLASPRSSAQDSTIIIPPFEEQNSRPMYESRNFMPFTSEYLAHPSSSLHAPTNTGVCIGRDRRALSMSSSYCAIDPTKYPTAAHYKPQEHRVTTVQMKPYGIKNFTHHPALLTHPISEKTYSDISVLTDISFDEKIETRSTMLPAQPQMNEKHNYIGRCTLLPRSCSYSYPHSKLTQTHINVSDTETFNKDVTTDASELSQDVFFVDGTCNSCLNVLQDSCDDFVTVSLLEDSDSISDSVGGKTRSNPFLDHSFSCQSEAKQLDIAAAECEPLHLKRNAFNTAQLHTQQGSIDYKAGPAQRTTVTTIPSRILPLKRPICGSAKSVVRKSYSSCFRVVDTKQRQLCGFDSFVDPRKAALWRTIFLSSIAEDLSPTQKLHFPILFKPKDLLRDCNNNIGDFVRTIQFLRRATVVKRLQQFSVSGSFFSEIRHLWHEYLRPSFFLSKTLKNMLSQPQSPTRHVATAQQFSLPISVRMHSRNISQEISADLSGLPLRALARAGTMLPSVISLSSKQPLSTQFVSMPTVPALSDLTPSTATHDVHSPGVGQRAQYSTHADNTDTLPATGSASARAVVTSLHRSLRKIPSSNSVLSDSVSCSTKETFPGHLFKLRQVAARRSSRELHADSISLVDMRGAKTHQNMSWQASDSFDSERDIPESEDTENVTTQSDDLALALPATSQRSNEVKDTQAQSKLKFFFPATDNSSTRSLLRLSVSECPSMPQPLFLTKGNMKCSNSTSSLPEHLDISFLPHHNITPLEHSDISVGMYAPVSTQASLLPPPLLSRAKSVLTNKTGHASDPPISNHTLSFTQESCIDSLSATVSTTTSAHCYCYPGTPVNSHAKQDLNAATLLPVRCLSAHVVRSRAGSTDFSLRSLKRNNAMIMRLPTAQRSDRNGHSSNNDIMADSSSQSTSRVETRRRDKLDLFFMTRTDKLRLGLESTEFNSNMKKLADAKTMDGISMRAFVNCGDQSIGDVNNSAVNLACRESSPPTTSLSSLSRELLPKEVLCYTYNVGNVPVNVFTANKSLFEVTCCDADSSTLSEEAAMLPLPRINALKNAPGALCKRLMKRTSSDRKSCNSSLPRTASDTTSRNIDCPIKLLSDDSNSISIAIDQRRYDAPLHTKETETSTQQSAAFSEFHQVQDIIDKRKVLHTASADSAVTSKENEENLDSVDSGLDMRVTLQPKAGRNPITVSHLNLPIVDNETSFSSLASTRINSNLFRASIASDFEQKRNIVKDLLQHIEKIKRRDHKTVARLIRRSKGAALAFIQHPSTKSKFSSALLENITSAVRVPLSRYIRRDFNPFIAFMISFLFTPPHMNMIMSHELLRVNAGRVTPREPIPPALPHGSFIILPRHGRSSFMQPKKSSIVASSNSVVTPLAAPSCAATTGFTSQALTKSLRSQSVCKDSLLRSSNKSVNLPTSRKSITHEHTVRNIPLEYPTVPLNAFSSSTSSTTILPTNTSIDFDDSSDSSNMRSSDSYECSNVLAFTPMANQTYELDSCLYSARYGALPSYYSSPSTAQFSNSTVLIPRTFPPDLKGVASLGGDRLSVPLTERGHTRSRLSISIGKTDRPALTARCSEVHRPRLFSPREYSAIKTRATENASSSRHLSTQPFQLSLPNQRFMQLKYSLLNKDETALSSVCGSHSQSLATLNSQQENTPSTFWYSSSFCYGQRRNGVPRNQHSMSWFGSLKRASSTFLGSSDKNRLCNRETRGCKSNSSKESVCIPDIGTKAPLRDTDLHDLLHHELTRLQHKDATQPRLRTLAARRGSSQASSGAAGASLLNVYLPVSVGASHLASSASSKQYEPSLMTSPLSHHKMMPSPPASRSSQTTTLATPEDISVPASLTLKPHLCDCPSCSQSATSKTITSNTKTRFPDHSFPSSRNVSAYSLQTSRYSQRRSSESTYVALQSASFSDYGNSTVLVSPPKKPEQPPTEAPKPLPVYDFQLGNIFNTTQAVEEIVYREYAPGESESIYASGSLEYSELRSNSEATHNSFF